MKPILRKTLSEARWWSLFNTTASFAYDLVNQRYMRNGAATSLALSLSETRASPAWVLQGNGVYDEVASGNPAIGQGVGGQFSQAFTNQFTNSTGPEQFPSGSNADQDLAPLTMKVGETNFSDDFNRPDTLPGAGIGNGWSLRLPYDAGGLPPSTDQGYLSDGAFTCDADEVVYAVRDAGEEITRIQGSIIFRDGGGINGATAALVISSADTYVVNMLHVVISRSVAKIQKRVSGGAFVDLATITFSPALSLDAEYEVIVNVSGDFAVININGQSATCEDSDIPSVIGQYVFCECYHPYASMSDLVSWTSFEIGDANAGQRITTTVANGYGQRNITVPDDSNTHVAWSGFLSKTEATQNSALQAILLGGSNTTRYATFNPNTGVVASVSAGASCTITEHDADTWHVLFTATNDSSGNTLMAVTLSPSTTAIGESLDVWGSVGVLDHAGRPPYIETTGTAATRAADVPLVVQGAGSVPWPDYDIDAGATLRLVFEPSDIAGIEAFRLSDGTADNYLTVRRGASDGVEVECHSGGVEVFTDESTTDFPTSLATLELYMEQDATVTVSLDGTVLSDITQTSDTLPDFTQLSLACVNGTTTVKQVYGK